MGAAAVVVIVSVAVAVTAESCYCSINNDFVISIFKINSRYNTICLLVELR